MAEVVSPGYDAIAALLPVVSVLAVLCLGVVAAVGLFAVAGWGVSRR